MSSLPFLNAFMDRRSFMRLCIQLAYRTVLTVKNGESLIDDVDYPLDPIGAAMLYAMPNPAAPEDDDDWEDLPVAVYAGPDMGDPVRPALDNEEVAVIDVYGGPDMDRSKPATSRSPRAGYPLNFSVPTTSPDAN